MFRRRSGVMDIEFWSVVSLVRTGLDEARKAGKVGVRKRAGGSGLGNMQGLHAVA
jgi:hypothetical protein